MKLSQLKQTPLAQGWFALQFLWQVEAGLRPIRLLFHPGLGQIVWEGQGYQLDAKGHSQEVSAKCPQNHPASQIRALMAGTVAEMAVEAGTWVKEGDLLCILEAMKMRLEVTAPHSAQVQAVAVKASETVYLGQVLLELGECSDSA